MRILGIDPGFATIGFGLVEAQRAQVHMVTYGAITTPAGLPLSRRLLQIGEDMEELIGQLKPDVISIEELFFNTNITTGCLLYTSIPGCCVWIGSSVLRSWPDSPAEPM